MAKLTLEQKKKQLEDKLNEEHKIFLKKELEKLEKSEAADAERINVDEKVETSFQIFVKAIESNSNNVTTLIDTFEKEYYAQYFENAGEARKQITKRQNKELQALEKQHKTEKLIFYTKYGQLFELEQSKSRATPLQHKLNYVSGLTNIDGTPKYKLNDSATAIIGAKGEELKSTIVFNFDGKKQTLNAKNLLAFLKTKKDKGVARLEEFEDMIEDEKA